MKRSLFIMIILGGFWLSGCGDCFPGHKEPIGGGRYFDNGAISTNLILQDEMGEEHELTWHQFTQSGFSTAGPSGRFDIIPPGLSIKLRLGMEIDSVEMIFCYTTLCEGPLLLRASESYCIEQESPRKNETLQSCTFEFDVDFPWTAPEAWGFPLAGKEFFIKGTIDVEVDEITFVAEEETCVQE